MSTPVSGSVSWNTPVTINSGDVVTATDLNNLNKDVAFLRARPYAVAWQTTAPTTAALVNSTDLSANNGRALFSTGNGGAYGSSISSTAVGAISILSDGRFATSTSVAGLYRGECQMMVNAVASGFARVSAILFDSSGTQVGAIPGTWAASSTAYNAVSTVRFVIPFNVAVTGMGTVSQVRFIGQYVTASLNVVTNDLNGNGPGSSPRQFNTIGSLEYLGTSTGAY